MFIIVFRCFFHLQEKAILKAQHIITVNNDSENRIRGNKRQNCTVNDTINNNCFSLEMNSTKFIRNNH